MDDQTALSPLELEQGSDAWRAYRCGKVTASRVADIIRKTKTGVSASRKNYAAELICEHLTGTVAEGYKSGPMEWGTQQEPRARELYSLMTDHAVRKIGFVDHPGIPMTGASPDGWIADDGEVQFKCPNTATHIETLHGAPIDPDYLTQMQWGLACSRRAWCDFVSFDPRLPPEMQLHVRRVMRDPVRIVELEREVRAFLAELDATADALRKQYPRPS